MKETIIILSLLLGNLYTQAQTKEETIAYINKLVSESKPELTDTDPPGCKTFTELHINQFTENRFEATLNNDFNTNNNPSCTPHFSEFISDAYEQINYKYLVDSFEIRNLCRFGHQVFKKNY